MARKSDPDLGRPEPPKAIRGLVIGVVVGVLLWIVIAVIVANI